MADRNYRGIYLIGDKAKDLISHVQVIDSNGNGRSSAATRIRHAWNKA